jgi:serine-type D-Ala-D-Ala carboxypeptidase/endopeptidase (penicillin-binding protein 4)
MKKIDHLKLLVVAGCFLGAMSQRGLAGGFAGLDSFFSDGEAIHGVSFVRLSDGKVLYEKNADAQLSPASVTKVITGACVMSYFGPATTFETPIYVTQRPKGGVVNGDLIVKGSGDPMLISELMGQMAFDLKSRGIQTIKGRVIIDNELFDEEFRDESRKDGAKASSHAYDAPVSAFAINFNTVAVNVAPTANNQPAIATLNPFPLASVKLQGKVQTTAGDSDQGVQVSRQTAGKSTVIQVSGRIGEGAGIKKVYRSVADPRTLSQDYLKGFLVQAGIKVGELTIGRKSVVGEPFYKLQGYDMRRIVNGLNTFSNNFTADMLTKKLGAVFFNEAKSESPGSGTLEHGVAVLSRFLKSDVGLKDSFTLLNGSGLSIENRMTAKQVAQVLVWMERQADLFPDYLGSLPASGWDGTLKKRVKNSEELQGVIRAKTGTLTEPITVASIAGYFRHPQEGWIAFVILSNGQQGRSQPGLVGLRAKQDKALKSLF